MAHQRRRAGPRWLRHSLPLERVYSRYNVRRGFSAWLGDFISPGIQVDRDWHPDETNIRGASPEGLAVTGVTDFWSCLLFNASSDVTLLVRKIDFEIQWQADLLGFNDPALEVNLFTPVDGYNPVALSIGQFLPFLFTGEEELRFGSGLVFSGFNTALQIVVVNGTPINPAIGPRYTAQAWVPNAGAIIAGVSEFPQPIWTPILDWNDPPMLIRPGKSLAVQQVNPTATHLEILKVNFYWSERRGKP